MKIFNFIKKQKANGKEKTTEDIILTGYLEEMKETHKQLSEEVRKGTLSLISAKAYHRHLPISGKHLGHLKETYNIASQCWEMLYNYCKQKHYIDNSITLEDFINTF